MMAATIQAAGGLGLFLLGMSVMTDGLKSMADKRLRSILARSTRGPVSGVCTGAVATAMVQSSSATTVAAVGFVHAGLLTFSEALGIIFGANIGTTITGWLVALIGFKLQLGEAVLPLILFGMVLRLTIREPGRSIGTALAGFGLIFVGISMLQTGMSVFEGRVTPDSFPPDTLAGRLLLVLIGAVITLVTQSSSAGVATALAAVHTGTITLAQAAALVIGMDFGTTVTALMATIGGNIQARRTGFAHVIYNGITAAGALVLLSPYLIAIDRIWQDAVEPELALVGFHTFFNAVGVLAILPFTRRFARLIERLLPERGNLLVRRLDRALRDSPEVALRVVLAALQDIAQAICRAILPGLQTAKSAVSENMLPDIEDAIEHSREYLEQLRLYPDHAEQLDDYTRAAHVLDHLYRLARRAHDRVRLSRVRDDAELAAMTDLLTASVESLSTAEFPIPTEIEAKAQQINQKLKAAMRSYRIRTLRSTAAGRLSTKNALKRMDAARYIRRLGYHIWRIADHTSSVPVGRKPTGSA